MGIQPTGSRSALLLQCPFPFDPELEIPPELEVKEAPRYGLAYHYVMQRVVPRAIAKAIERSKKRVVPAPALVERALAAQGIGKASVRAELLGHVIESLDLLLGWLRGKNEYDKNFLRPPIRVEVEASYGVDVGTLRATPGLGWRSEKIEAPDETHRYELEEKQWGSLEPVGRRVVPMTLDLKIEPAGDPAKLVKSGDDWSLLFDYKTGRRGDWSSPTKVPQMRSAGLVPERLSRVYLAVLDANRAGISAVYSDEFSKGSRAKHTQDMRAALSLVGSGFMRTGPECDFCPARNICPAKLKDIVEEGHAIVTAVTGSVEAIALARGNAAKLSPLEKAGALHFMHSHVEKWWHKIKPKVKELVAAGEVVTRPVDGKVLTLTEHEVERMPQKKDYVERYGKMEAERRLAALRKRKLLVKKKEMWLEAEENERVRR